MRSLSQRAADRCEGAKHPRCRCRCGGALHGAKRGQGPSFFESLPAEDPHHVPSEEEKKASRASKQQLELRWPGLRF